jgi:hypothetical protein
MGGGSNADGRLETNHRLVEREIPVEYARLEFRMLGT